MTAKNKTKELKNVVLKKRALKVVQLLQRYYPDAKCSLNFSNPVQLLVATILSAQCTDERVNKVTPELFKKCPTANDLANIPVVELEALIRSTGFYKNKAKNISACAKQLVSQYGGRVPETMDQLHALPGVGRKTANVVLGNAFGIPGMVVDTHVTRLSNRLGFVKTENAVLIEQELEPLVPKEHWTHFSHWLIYHGRAVCKARSPECEKCFLSELCPKVGVG